MPVINTITDGDKCWPDLAEKRGAGQVIHLGNGAPAIQFARLVGSRAT
jgi:hypothetical protein